MNSAPLLSVVTITLNDREGFLRTAESLLQQPYLDRVEWLIVDGGSTDGTLEAAYEAREDPRAPAQGKVLEGPDGGIADAMIRGGATATGDYLQFLNSGDRYHDAHALEHVVPRLLGSRSIGDSKRPTWLYGQCQVVDEKERSVRPLHARRYSPLRHAYHVTRINHQAVFVSRDEFESMGGFRREAGTAIDFELLVRLGQREAPLVVDEVIIDYLEGGYSQVHFARQLRLAAQARRDVLQLTGVVRVIDRAFTSVFILYGRAKLAMKPLLVRILGDGFLRWWGERHVVGGGRRR